MLEVLSFLLVVMPTNSSSKQEIIRGSGVETAPASVLSEIPKYILNAGIMSPEEWNQLSYDHKVALAKEAYGDNWEQKIQAEKSFEQGGGRSSSETVKSTTIESAPSKEDIELDEVRAEFERAKSELGSIERGEAAAAGNASTESVDNAGTVKLSQEEKRQVFTEKGGTHNLGIPNFFGYNPPPQFSNRVHSLADSGDVTESKTWLAALIRKIWMSMHTE
ncbi:hypothetical protein GF357_00645 [Candidatus Dojkabacteria bacterium]|nr:hypothetical protein [Candidatus Dojkabacteria bacterium]